MAACCLLLGLGLVGCRQHDPEPPKARLLVNSFPMQVDGQVWKPYQSPVDSCMGSTFGATYLELHYNSGKVNPFYTFHATRDPSGREDTRSENLLRMRVMNVTEPGLYLLEGTYKLDFDSFIIFVIQQPVGRSKRYVNIPTRRPFVVYVQEFIAPSRGTSSRGIKGWFAGVVYNEADPSDLLVIEKGKFTFATVNYPDNC